MLITHLGKGTFDPAIMDELQDILVRMLSTAAADMEDQLTHVVHPRDTYDYAEVLPDILLQFHFVTLEELDNPTMLNHILIIPD